MLVFTVIESISSIFIAALLGIKGDRHKTMCFGNSGSALSFNQKINLLIDIGALKKEDRSRLQAFMEIRNQFMHNVDATSHLECAKFCETYKFIIKLYKIEGETNIEVEVHYKLAFKKLSDDVLKIIISLKKLIEEKFKLDASNKFNSIANEAFEKEIWELPDIINEELKKVIKENKTVSTKKLVNVADKASAKFVLKFSEGLIETGNKY